MLSRIVLPVVLLLVASCGMGADSAKPIIIAHRGASGYLPEHTLEAKTAAYFMGADFLEQDLVLSKDDVLMVLHDVQIDSVTDVAERFPDRKRENGRYYALDFTAAELKQLKVTERFNPKTKAAVFKNRFPLWKSTFQISTFEEELQLIQGLNKSTGRTVGIYPEIKAPAWHRRQGHDISKFVLPVLERYGYRTKTDPFFLQCFEFPEVKRIRTELGFRGRMIQLLGDGADEKNLKTRAGLEEIAKVADGIGPALSHIASLSAEGKLVLSDLVTNAHAAKLAVHPYTCRADELPKYAKSMDQLFQIFFIEAGVDGIFTDFPDQGVAYLKAHPIL